MRGVWGLVSVQANQGALIPALGTKVNCGLGRSFLWRLGRSLFPLDTTYFVTCPWESKPLSFPTRKWMYVPCLQVSTPLSRNLGVLVLLFQGGCASFNKIIQRKQTAWRVSFKIFALLRFVLIPFRDNNRSCPEAATRVCSADAAYRTCPAGRGTLTQRGRIPASSRETLALAGVPVIVCSSGII